MLMIKIIINVKKKFNYEKKNNVVIADTPARNNVQVVNMWRKEPTITITIIIITIIITIKEPKNQCQ